MKYLFSIASEVDLKSWRSHEHQTLLNVTSDVGVASDAYWVLWYVQAGRVGTSDALHRLSIRHIDTRYYSRVTKKGVHAVCALDASCVS